jgi:hypothetical protein
MTPKLPEEINAELIVYRLDEIKNELAEMKNQFVTKTESQALKHQIEELRQDLQESKKILSREIADLRKSRTIMGWIYPTATAVFTAIATYVTIEFLRRK